MDKKKILIVSRTFFPNNSPRSYRTTELAKEFSLQGHDVTVLIPRDQKYHEQFGKDHRLAIKDLGTPRWIRLNFGNSKIGKYLTRVFSRGLQLLFEYPDIELLFLVKKALKKESKFDLLVSIAVPYSIHWGVAAARSKKHQIATTWVADCGDPFMGETTDTFRRWFYFKYVEKWFMRKADFISIPIENAKKAYYPDFHHKIRIIPQGFKIKSNQIVSNQKPNPIPTFAYAGGLNLKVRDPRPLFEFLSSLEINFLFYIYTKRLELIEPLIKKIKGKVIVSDVIPRDELLPRLASMDFLVNFDNNTTTQLPSKLIDYAICNRPILNITDKLDKIAVLEFLSGNYNHGMPVMNLEPYRIENVCCAFIALTHE